MAIKTKKDIIQEIKNRYPQISLEKLEAALDMVMKKDGVANDKDCNKNNLYFRPAQGFLKGLISKIANKN